MGSAASVKEIIATAHPDIVANIQTLRNALEFLVKHVMGSSNKAFYKTCTIEQLTQWLNHLDTPESSSPEASTTDFDRQVSEVVLSLTTAALTGILESGRGTSDQQQKEKEKVLKLPLALENFTPLHEREALKDAIDACANAETIFRDNPGEESFGPQLDHAVDALHKQYKKAIGGESENRARDPITWRREMGEVVAAGSSHFEAVYDSVYKTITTSESEALSKYHETMGDYTWQSLTKQSAKQQQGTVRDLVAAASSTKEKFFDPFLKEMHGALIGDQHVSVEFPMTANLKGVRRIVEKIALQAEGNGDPSRVLDAARAMVVSTDTTAIVDVLSYLEDQNDYAVGSIDIVRVKNRFLSPSLGGWRDVMVNFSFEGDPSKHICELQIVHKNMLTARKGLPGHSVYNRVRNAWELLEHFGVPMDTWWQDCLGFSHNCLLSGLVRLSEAITDNTAETTNVEWHPTTDITLHGGFIRGSSFPLFMRDRCSVSTVLSCILRTPCVELPSSWPEGMPLTFVHLAGKGITGTVQ